MSRSGVLLTVLGALLVTVGWYLLLVRPTQASITDLEDQITAVEDEMLLLRAQRAALQRIEDNMLSYMAAIGEIERSIPATPNTASLIDDLFVLAAETGVRWESGAYGNPTEVEGQGYLEIPVNVAIEGQFFEVLGYLYGIADMERLVRIETIGISPFEDDNGFTVLSVAITARAFTTANIAIPGADAAEDGAADGTGEEAPADGEAEGSLVMEKI